MSLSIFSVRNKYYKNGIWWFTKMLNRVVGEETYNALRVQRRITANQIYYVRQQILYRMFVDMPDVACMCGVYPKVDNSHGYGSNTAYEMYRDFQENTLNSDGSFSMWVYFFCGIYVLHEIYTYFMPWYWNKTASCKNGEESRHRMKEALNSTILEDSYGFQILEWGFAPHIGYQTRLKITDGLSHPDDVRAMAATSLSRKNRYKEHYEHAIDDRKRMIGGF